MTDPFLRYTEGFARLMREGQGLLAEQALVPDLAAPAPDAPVCMVFSPHPDDEAIAGAVPWRLRTQAHWRVVNVAVTLGSKVERRQPRWEELTRCCAHLGFELVSASGENTIGFERIGPDGASLDPAHWAACVERVARLLDQYRPRVIVCPHAHDGHPAHIGTYALVVDALRQLAPSRPLDLLLSEYWNTQLQPGLMVELGDRDVAVLIAALSQHRGEVARNPYHLSLPAWFIDGVRRGAERVLVPGGPAPEYSFAALYGWQRWSAGALTPMVPRALALSEPIASLFP